MNWIDAVMALVFFAWGYILGAYRQREYIKRMVANGRWDWNR